MSNIVSLHDSGSDDQRSGHEQKTIQLNLPLDTVDYAGIIFFIYDNRLNYDSMENAILKYRVTTVVDLRKVPFFEGDNDRHKKINSVLSKYHVPIYHLGAALSLTIPQSFPVILIKNEIAKLMKNSDYIMQNIEERLAAGSCMLVIDKSETTYNFAAAASSVILSKFSSAQVIVNNEWKQILNGTR